MYIQDGADPRNVTFVGFQAECHISDPASVLGCMRKEQAPGTRRSSLNLALAVIAVAQLMVVLDIAVVNVALPSIQRSFALNADGLEWVANAYAITFGGLLLLGGRAADRFGRLRMFGAGIALFAAGSLAGGLATTASWLIAARAFQGIGAAIMSPATLSLLADTFPAGPQRNRALGVYSAASAGGGAIGLLLGGVITTYLSWRWILFINVPIGLLLLIAAPRVLVAIPGVRRSLDVLGAIAVTGGTSLLAFGLSRVAVHSWGDSVASLSLVSSGVLLAGFLVIEALGREPLMPLNVFSNRNRSGAYVLSLAVGATLSGLLFLLTLFLQNVLGFSPLRAGLAFLPTAVGIGIGAGATSRLISRTGPRLPMATGSLLAAIALFWLSRITPSTDYVTGVLGPLVVLAVGLGQVFVSSSVVAIEGVGRGETGLASALINVGRQLGGSLGIAGMATIAATVTKNQLATTALLTHSAVNQALTAGFGSAFELGGFIALVGFAAAMILVRRSEAPAVELERQAA
jgi:EmrB/QacA subfamily drug resistance transporter